MAAIDLRKCLNAISDVVINRPRPLREFDQIYMKAADMLLQTEHLSRFFDGRSVIFVGDGDAISLCMVHLHRSELLEVGPREVLVLDFDERVVNSIRAFAKRFEIDDRVTAELYNVIDPLPERHWQRYEAFYTNPPFGATNGGRSVEAFLRRGVEASGSGARGCIVIADYETLRWTQEVMKATQEFLLSHGFYVSEVLPEFHHYHLDDVPALTSCTMAVKRLSFSQVDYGSEELGKEFVENFYGNEAPLNVKYIRDRTQGGKFPSRDYEAQPIDSKEA